MINSKPRLAVVLGDPAGIGPELVGRLLADSNTLKQAHIAIIADRAEFVRGMAIAGQQSEFDEIDSIEKLSFETDKPILIHQQSTSAGEYERGVSTIKGGSYCLDSLTQALDAHRAGKVDSILFAPLNKHSLHMAGMKADDELHWFARQLDFSGPVCEFNVLDGLWTSRVTSHIALKDVAKKITHEGVIKAIELIAQAVRIGGIESPRLAVCGLNPHNGDNGSFGREEIDIIAPAVLEAQKRGIPVEGPFAADTIFLKVQAPERQYDGVVTMYHDQGQIAMKLMGFWRGVTVQGGLPIPIATPAHGTAFDIQGQGKANPGAMLQAFQIACRMGKANAAHKKQ